MSFSYSLSAACATMGGGGDLFGSDTTLPLDDGSAFFKEGSSALIHTHNHNSSEEDLWAHDFDDSLETAAPLSSTAAVPPVAAAAKPSLPPAIELPLSASSDDDDGNEWDCTIEDTLMIPSPTASPVYLETNRDPDTFAPPPPLFENATGSVSGSYCAPVLQARPSLTSSCARCWNCQRKQREQPNQQYSSSSWYTLAPQEEAHLPEVTADQSSSSSAAVASFDDCDFLMTEGPEALPNLDDELLSICRQDLDEEEEDFGSLKVTTLERFNSVNEEELAAAAFPQQSPATRVVSDPTEAADAMTKPEAQGGAFQGIFDFPNVEPSSHAAAIAVPVKKKKAVDLKRAREVAKPKSQGAAAARSATPPTSASAGGGTAAVQSFKRHRQLAPVSAVTPERKEGKPTISLGAALKKAAVASVSSPELDAKAVELLSPASLELAVPSLSASASSSNAAAVVTVKKAPKKASKAAASRKQKQQQHEPEACSSTNFVTPAKKQQEGQHEQEDDREHNKEEEDAAAVDLEEGEEGETSEGGAHKRFYGYQMGMWEKQYNELMDFRDKTGHCVVPFSYNQNVTLARWVKRQRYQYKLMNEGKPTTMTSERVAALEAIDFCWDPQGAIWYERLGELNGYRELYLSCNVPMGDPVHSKLAIWVKCQRRQYKLYQEGKQSTLTLERIHKLEQLGFEWKLRKCYKKQSTTTTTTMAVASMLCDPTTTTTETEVEEETEGI